MSEQNPYAPVGTPSLAPPIGVTVPPSGFAPPPPAGGFAPAPQQAYQTPGMALTELSFAPIPVDAPPAPVEPSGPPAPSLVADVLPSGGVARRLSIGSRAPLLALLLVLVLAAVAAVFGPGLLKKKEAPFVAPKKAPVVAPLASKPVVVAPVTPAKPKAVAKPVVKPLVGKTLSVTPANSRTIGAAYSVTVPTGWTSKLNSGRDATFNADVRLSNDGGLHSLSVTTYRTSYAKGPLTVAKVASLNAALIKGVAGAKSLPGQVKATVAGVSASGFDATAPVKTGTMTVRNLFFEHGGVVYVATFGASTADFSKSVPTFNQILTTVKFAK